jgi:hypothetical protein
MGQPFILRGGAGASNKYRRPSENTLTSAEDSIIVGQ